MDHGANTEEDMKRGNRSRRLFSHVPFVYTECTPRCMLFSDKTATCARERCFSTYFQGFLSSCIQCILCIPKIFIEIKYYIEKERIKEEKQRRERWWLRCRWRWATDDGTGHLWLRISCTAETLGAYLSGVYMYTRHTLTQESSIKAPFSSDQSEDMRRKSFDKAPFSWIMEQTPRKT